MKFIMEAIVNAEADTKLELYEAEFTANDGTTFTGYSVTYLTPTHEEGGGYYTNNSEEYLTLEEAKAAFGTRLVSEDPFNVNKDYTYTKRKAFEAGPAK